MKSTRNFPSSWPSLLCSGLPRRLPAGELCARSIPKRRTQCSVTNMKRLKTRPLVTLTGIRNGAVQQTPRPILHGELSSEPSRSRSMSCCPLNQLFNCLRSRTQSIRSIRRSRC